MLQGSEIKSIRAGRVALKEAYVLVEGGQAYLHNAHIAAYDPAARQGHDPLRARKLLLHKKQIAKLAEETHRKGLARSRVPLKMYLSKGRAKLEIALARGKKNYDKRDAIAERDSQRDL